MEQFTVLPQPEQEAALLVVVEHFGDLGEHDDLNAVVLDRDVDRGAGLEDVGGGVLPKGHS